MDQNTTSKTYICTGSCHAEITEEQYNNGLTACGADVCTMKGQPFVERKSPDMVINTQPDDDVIINN
jgi:hypothetical protein